MFFNDKYPRGVVLLAHGAGAGMDHEFMVQMDSLLSGDGFQVIRFEFPYMQKRREDGKKRPPDRLDVLLQHYRQLIEEHSANNTPVYIAGKSMGGRVASMLLDETEAVAGFVFGYPFHPAGKPDRLRTEHLETLKKPLHVFQGTRDAMGSYEEVINYRLSESVHLHWLEDGNHDLKPRKASGMTQQAHLETVARCVKEIVS